MSFLAPLFVAGILTVSLPIFFHLIRRAPRGRVEFSSLMFLSPSPPRITKRSRIDNWLLLLLRGLILCLLALAFARPFLREAADASSEGMGKRVAILLDASASMRREKLFDEARDEIQRIVENAGPRDRIAIFAFDDRVREVVGFGDLDEAPPAQRPELVRSRLKDLEPSWGSTNLGGALVYAADVLDSLDSAARSAAAEREGATAEEVDAKRSEALEIVLVSDLASGSALEALATYDWPKDVQLDVERVRVDKTTNAGLTVLEKQPEEADEEAEEKDGKALRVLVTNDEGSSTDTFRLAWADANGPIGSANESTIQVPAGERRVVSIPFPGGETASADRLVLAGDDHDYDNTFYYAAPQAEDVTVLYVGEEDPKDTNALRFYAEIALSSDPLRRVRFVTHAASDPMLETDDASTELVIIAQPVSEALEKSLMRYAAGGGTVLVVLRENDPIDAAGRLLGTENLRSHEIRADDYAMLVDVDFSHPIFAPFKDPRFADFTQVRFWRHRELSLGTFDEGRVRALAKFDGGSPALLERTTGSGRVLVLASGWSPRDSQLALSTKFVPLISRILELRRGASRRLAAFHVGQAIPLPVRTAAARTNEKTSKDDDAKDPVDSASTLEKRATLTRPDGSESPIADADTSIDDARTPGIYRFDDASTSWRFAVNLDAVESTTRPLEVEALEARGVVLEGALEDPELKEQKLALELEQSQKIWKWLLVAALGLAILETWLAGRMTRAVEANEVTA